MNRIICCLTALLPLIAVQSSSAQSLEPGRWRILTTTLANPPSPPMVATRCLTPDDTADLEKTFGPRVATENSECKSVEFKRGPSELTWRLQCKGQLDMDVAGQFIFESPTRYSALISTKATMLDRIVKEETVSIAAERIGECR